MAQVPLQAAAPLLPDAKAAAAAAAGGVDAATEQKPVPDIT